MSVTITGCDDPLPLVGGRYEGNAELTHDGSSVVSAVQMILELHQANRALSGDFQVGSLRYSATGLLATGGEDDRTFLVLSNPLDATTGRTVACAADGSIPEARTAGQFVPTTVGTTVVLGFEGVVSGTDCEGTYQGVYAGLRIAVER